MPIKNCENMSDIVIVNWILDIRESNCIGRTENNLETNICVLTSEKLGNSTRFFFKLYLLEQNQ